MGAPALDASAQESILISSKHFIFFIYSNFSNPDKLLLSLDKSHANLIPI